MVGATSITATLAYTYNGDGLLLAERLDGEETTFTWDQALALPQVLATSNGLRALYGIERIGVYQDGAWAYPLGDVLGSVRQWTDADGTVLGLQGYGPYGETVVPIGPPLASWGYTGEWEDASGLVYLRARWYNPAWGRFTQVDPEPGALYSPATRHTYGYVGGSPVRYQDATGRSWLVLGAALLAGAVDYGYQVYRNRQAGLSWSDSLVRKVNFREVVATAGAGGLAALALPELVSMGGTSLAGVGYGLTAGGSILGVRLLTRLGGQVTVASTTARLVYWGSWTAASPFREPEQCARGNRAHYEKLPGELRRRYPKTEFEIRPRGAKGWDVTYREGPHPSKYPGSTWPEGFDYAELKPASPAGLRGFYTDLNSGKLPPETVPLLYNPSTLELLDDVP